MIFITEVSKKLGEERDFMLTYEDFKEKVARSFVDYLSDEFKGSKNVIVHIRPVEKINRTLDGISLADSEGRTVSPVIYVNDMYEQYRRYGNVNDVMRVFVKTMEREIREFQDYPLPDLTDADSKIVFQLVNTEQNRKLLQGMPHREFHNLSVIYRLVVKSDGQGMHSAVIKNGLAKMLEFDEGQLFRLAKNNTRKLFPPLVKPIGDFLCEELNLLKPGLDETGIWVITNESKVNGAACILYGDVLHELSEKLHDDLYILPSSLHEVIEVPASMGKPDGLAQMVCEVNETGVEPEDRLSNRVYHYDRGLMTLTAVTDTGDGKPA